MEWIINKLLCISNKFPLQGTMEWINLRKNYITGTKITALKKHNNFNFSIFPSKEFTGNKYTRHGNYFEDIAIKKYEIKSFGNVIDLNFITHETIKNLGFSPDGYDVNNNCLIEIKCPYNANLCGDIIKEEHFDQIQLGLRVLKSHGINTSCMYIVYDTKKDHIDIR